jgi:hypothetical protein
MPEIKNLTWDNVLTKLKDQENQNNNNNNFSNSDSNTQATLDALLNARKLTNLTQNIEYNESTDFSLNEKFFEKHLNLRKEFKNKRRERIPRTTTTNATTSSLKLNQKKFAPNFDFKKSNKSKLSKFIREDTTDSGEDSDIASVSESLNYSQIKVSNIDSSKYQNTNIPSNPHHIDSSYVTEKSLDHILKSLPPQHLEKIQKKNKIAPKRQKQIFDKTSFLGELGAQDTLEH